MNDLFTWLDNAVGNLAKKVLSALGIGWVSFEGITGLAAQVRDYVSAAWGQMPADVLAIASMAGFGVAFGVVMGAIMYRAAMSALGHLGRLVA